MCTCLYQNQLWTLGEKANKELIAAVSYFGFLEKMDKYALEARERIERELLG